MKKLFAGLILGVALCGMFSFAKSIYEVKDITAETKKVEGLAIFTDCKPVKEYEVIGTVTLSEFSFYNGSKFYKIQTRLSQKAKEKFPDAEGLIYDIAEESAQVIKFKK